MNEVLKQRLVGALILVALGVIFWPIIFVESEHQPMGQQQVIPPQPKLSQAPVTAPSPSGLRGSPAFELEPDLAPRDSVNDAVETPATTADAEASVDNGALTAQATPIAEPAPPTAAQATAKRARTESPKPLSVDADGVPEAWILQVVSVSSEEKANKLRDRLLQMNEKGYVKRVSSNGKTLYRVYIGPRFEQQKLEELRPRIDAEFGVKSMIRRYVP